MTKWCGFWRILWPNYMWKVTEKPNRLKDVLKRRQWLILSGLYGEPACEAFSILESGVIDISERFPYNFTI
ncbi:hypothetical protein J25TS5_51590 [Paenibacillus faecis]|nr:hypothetical protein J25TS5_51590 [Paenibacillus faecis]